MPKYAATIQFVPPTRAQWTITSVKREDGQGYTTYGLESVDWGTAIKDSFALFTKMKKEAENSEFGMLVDFEPDFLILSQEEPSRHEAIAWAKVSG